MCDGAKCHWQHHDSLPCLSDIDNWCDDIGLYAAADTIVRTVYVVYVLSLEIPVWHVVPLCLFKM